MQLEERNMNCFIILKTAARLMTLTHVCGVCCVRMRAIIEVNIHFFSAALKNYIFFLQMETSIYGAFYSHFYDVTGKHV